MTRPTRDEVLIQMADLVAQRSTCGRAQVGAVVATGARPLVTGYNGAPSGLPHCDHTPGSDEPCWQSVHAEANAIAWAARLGIKLAGATLYATHSPCVPCSQLVINSGIRRVVYRTAYRDKRGLELMMAAQLDIDLMVGV